MYATRNPVEGPERASLRETRAKAVSCPWMPLGAGVTLPQQSMRHTPKSVGVSLSVSRSGCVFLRGPTKKWRLSLLVSLVNPQKVYSQNDTTKSTMNHGAICPQILATPHWGGGLTSSMKVTINRGPFLLSAWIMFICADVESRCFQRTSGRTWDQHENLVREVLRLEG